MTWRAEEAGVWRSSAGLAGPNTTTSRSSAVGGVEGDGQAGVDVPVIAPVRPPRRRTAKRVTSPFRAPGRGHTGYRVVPMKPTVAGAASAPDRLSSRGRLIRVVVTLAATALLLFGTLWGQDDLFPFGPFRMYAVADRLDDPVADTRFELVDTSGATVELTQNNTGIRRAEIEGQLGRFRADPSLLRVIDQAYAARNPNAPAAVTLRIVIRWNDLKDGIPTGNYHDETVAIWNPPAVDR